jgi:hypothetical protein
MLLLKPPLPCCANRSWIRWCSQECAAFWAVSPRPGEQAVLLVDLLYISPYPAYPNPFLCFDQDYFLLTMIVFILGTVPAFFTHPQPRYMWRKHS